MVKKSVGGEIGQEIGAICQVNKLVGKLSPLVFFLTITVPTRDAAVCIYA